MINYLNAVIARERERELRSRHRHGRVPGTLAGPRTPADAPQEPDVSIRVARPTDDQALARLAQLDSRPTPSGRVLVAEVAGELLARPTRRAPGDHPTTPRVVRSARCRLAR